ncbi:TfuA domain-containing protein [Streptomyces aureus]|uniref:TfuA domain-containing protein n=1 Tax=Streptomyces aureus TaxID=193461 RepID=UPI0036A5B080
MDGIYHHRLALRHKEILDALARGVAVLGAASIGALRAAELDEFGMIGVGRVYDWYRSGVFDGDDAVSVAHGETRSPAGINVPLVNLHTAVMAACAAGVLRQEAGRTLLARLEREYYPLRTRERILTLVKECGETPFADWYGRQLVSDPDAFDQKRVDALEACALAERLDKRPRPEDRWTTGGTGGRDWATEYHRRWRNRFATAVPDLHHRVAYQQVFNTEFPDVWWNFLHASVDPTSPGAAGGLRDHVQRQLGPVALGWLDDPRLRARITRLLAPLPDLMNRHDARLLLHKETPEDRALSTDWLERTRRHLDAHPGRSLSQIRETVCARLLGRIWGVGDGDLATECGRRGFSSVRQASAAFRPFAIGYLSDLQEPKTRGERSHVQG